jgi:hypothetical protein
MFVDQHIALALRKERLLVQAGQQREQIAQLGSWLKKPCAAADKVIEAGRYAKAHPWTAGVAACAAVLLGRRHVFRMAGYAWSAWRTWRFVNRWAHESGLLKSFKNK